MMVEPRHRSCQHVQFPRSQATVLTILSSSPYGRLFLFPNDFEAPRPPDSLVQQEYTRCLQRDLAAPLVV